MKKKKYRKVIGTGYPWFSYGETKESKNDYVFIHLLDQPGRWGFPAGTKVVPLAPIVGASQKIKLIVEYVK